MSAKLYQTIATNILDTLKTGVRPWEQCYSVSQHHFPIRITGHAYRGINRLSLLIAMQQNSYTSPLWMTFNQAKQLGASIRKGEKSTLSLFFKPLEFQDQENDEIQQAWIARANRVFNADQITNLPEELLHRLTPPATKYDNTPLERAETFIRNIPATCQQRDGTPAFAPGRDLVYMPSIQQFKTSEHYYATYLHELGHWTGHRDRLNRSSLVNHDKDNYYREELCAELTASFLCPELGIEPLIDDEHAPYLQHYIQLLEHEPRAFIHACSQAEKAADYLKDFQQPD